MDKVKSADVREYLLRVADTALDRHHPEWGGEATNGLLFRLGVLEEDEELEGDELGECRTAARTYLLVYIRQLQGDATYSIKGVLTLAETYGAALCLR